MMDRATTWPNLRDPTRDPGHPHLRNHDPLGARHPPPPSGKGVPNLGGQDPALVPARFGAPPAHPGGNRDRPRRGPRALVPTGASLGCDQASPDGGGPWPRAPESASRGHRTRGGMRSRRPGEGRDPGLAARPRLIAGTSVEGVLKVGESRAYFSAVERTGRRPERSPIFAAAPSGPTRSCPPLTRCSLQAGRGRDDSRHPGTAVGWRLNPPP